MYVHVIHCTFDSENFNGFLRQKQRSYLSYVCSIALEVSLAQKFRNLEYLKSHR